MPPRPRKGARENIATVINDALSVAKVQELADLALSAEMYVDGTCPECGCNRIRVPMPDINKRIAATTALLEQAEGRPEQRAPGALKVVIERPPLK